MTARTPNAQLATLLQHAGLSRKAFARAVQVQADARSLVISVDHTSVARWLAGGSPRQETIACILAVLSARLGRSISAEESGFPRVVSFSPDLGLTYPENAEDAVSALAQLAEIDLSNEKGLSAASINASAWSEASLSWLVRPGVDALPVRHGGRSVGLGDVELVRRTTAMFSDMDGQFGGNHARAVVAQYLRSEVGPMLRGSYSEHVARALYSASAEAAHLLAWMSYDAGAHGVAQRYFIQALRLSQAANNVLLAASTLDAMSHQANYLGRHREAANLARAALSGTANESTATLKAHFHAMEARALATAGDKRGTELALSRASSWFERRAPDDDPEWIRYFNEAELAAEVGHCYRDLGDGRRAAAAATAALTGSPRSDFFVTMVRAEALLQTGDVEAACTVAHSAMEAGALMKSARATEYARGFRRRLGLMRSSSAALELENAMAANRLWVSAQ